MATKKHGHEPTPQSSSQRSEDVALNLEEISFDPPPGALLVGPLPAEQEAHLLVQRLLALGRWATARAAEIRDATPQLYADMDVDVEALPVPGDAETHREWHSEHSPAAPARGVGSLLDEFDAVLRRRKAATVARMSAIELLAEFTEEGQAEEYVARLAPRFPELTRRLTLRDTGHAIVAWRLGAGRRPKGGCTRPKWDVLATWLRGRGNEWVSAQTLEKEWVRWKRDRRREASPCGSGFPHP